MILIRVLSLFIITIFCLEVKGYEVTSDFERGIFWTSFPIQMYRYVTDSSQVSDLTSATENAVRDWEESTGQNLWDFVGDVEVNSGGVLVNNIRWSDNFGAETGYDPSRTLAVAIRYNNGSIFTKTEIILNGNHSNLRNNVDGMLLNTVMHELGHTIGLDHTNQYAIMAAYSNDLRELQYDDVEGGNYVYSQHVYRQSTGGIQMLGGGGSNDPFEQIAACGSIDFDSSGGGWPGSRFLVSLIIGTLSILLSSYLPIDKLLKRPSNSFV